MRALFFDRKLRLVRNYPMPKPRRGEALVKVLYAGVCATDIEILRGYMGFKGIPGHEFVGMVVSSPDRRITGKRVVGEINAACSRCACCKKGMSAHCPDRTVLGILGRDGAFAEYLSLPVENLHAVPEGVSDEEAVFAEPVAAAFKIASQVRVGKGMRALVVGDGRLGNLSAQVLRLKGADVTVAGRHRAKLKVIERLGLKTARGGAFRPRHYDLSVDCTGSDAGLDAALRAVRPRGTVVLKTTVAGTRKADLNRVVIDELTIVGSRCGPFGPALRALKQGKVRVKPLISKVFPLEDGVEALEFAIKSRNALKVLIRT